MNEFEKQFQEIEDYLKFEDYPLVIKRLIDFTLDTETLSCYLEMNQFLDWLDYNGNDTAGQATRLRQLIDQLYAFLKDKPQASREVLVTLKDVVKSYGTGRFGLGPIDLALYAGQIVGLVGENGNGKTTLLRSLCGELHPSGGTITYHFKYTDRYDLRTQLVYIPQRTDTWYGSMYQNLILTASSYGYDPEMIEPLTQLIITRLGLRKYRLHSWNSLSSGYKMRFELARMLLRKPKLLLIDEPLANLDILAQQTILEDFRAIAKSPFRPIGIVLSSQQLYEVEKTSDQVVFLKQGVQKNLREESGTTTETPENFLVIEFESSLTQGELGNLLQPLGLESLQFNGGTFIATFPESVTRLQFLEWVTRHEIPMPYFRDISQSTRRFFVS
ncbi:MAG: ATP-binding cassette domain-containing protein [Flavobacterium sp.]|jgi:ABC-2 type transport system ATP-binding protein|uniref:ABC transporter ATP-binding protein n=1 Tax=Flavobacterium sp. TaxID=239 RepID=UPI0022BFA50F|nr:ABC transporter ATP-binding protein [Flavobacterium sp.]MCZ8169443.1 ABC transporter ATP-binding protein [Flavobacterium sp.]MCZ8296823.1 ABC transporter ATP-binding protein [Flavobacterium sp.]